MHLQGHTGKVMELDFYLDIVILEPTSSTSYTRQHLNINQLLHYLCDFFPLEQNTCNFSSLKSSAM